MCVRARVCVCWRCDATVSLRAGLQTWLNFFVLCINAPDESEVGPLMEQAIDASHGDVVGWWSKQTVSLACRSMGKWEPLSQKIGPSRAVAEQDIKKWSSQVTDVVAVLKSLQREFDFEDKRVSS